MSLPWVSVSRGLVRAVLASVIAILLTGSSASAQDPARIGSIEGTVTTQGGAVQLPGVVVIVRGQSDQMPRQQVSDDNGHFVVPGVPAGRYRVRAALDGFEPVEEDAVVEPGEKASLTFELSIASVSEHVDVVAHAPVFEAETLASAEAVDTAEAQLLVPGQGVQSSLRLTTGVIQLPGGNSIDGGRPYQAGLQIGSATLTDPATNLARLSLPPEAVESVSVLPNPYEVEFGRFSSGVVVIQTKRAGDQWKAAVNNLEPALRLKRFTVVNVTGITVWQPSVEIGGPLVKGRVFLEQTAQYRYQTTDIPSRPETELKRNQSVSTLTRVDAQLSPRHTLTVAGGVTPNITEQATLGTFVPPEATVDVKDDLSHGMVTERALLGNATALETTLELHHYRTDVDPQGTAPMTLLPETTRGNFFNVQRRRTAAVQWIETASHSYKGRGGTHLFKVGLDVLHSSYDGSSESTPLVIARSDGTTARRLDFDGDSVQSVHSTDIAVFAQDRFQPASRVDIAFGGRVDRDGITSHANVAPRIGIVVRLNQPGTLTLRGGYGLFYERTPSVAGAFEQFERSTDTRFAADGMTPLGPPVLYTPVTAPGLQVAQSATWDVALDHRINHVLSVHAGVLDREGRHELIVEPVRTPQGGQEVMSSTGRSSYLQEEVEVHVGRGPRGDLNASYVHSSAREDLNSLLNFLDMVVQPVVGENAYAPAMADAPHRLLLRGRIMVPGGWQLLGTVDWRSGLPYSIVDEDLEFVGPRNAVRFPSYFRVDAGFERRLTIARMHPWIGMRVSNALNSFLPSDVQANVNSPAFGSFYNSVYREYRIAFRVEK